MIAGYLAVHYNIYTRILWEPTIGTIDRYVSIAGIYILNRSQSAVSLKDFWIKFLESFQGKKSTISQIDNKIISIVLCNLLGIEEFKTNYI